jgi:hypothetical protein
MRVLNQSMLKTARSFGEKREGSAYYLHSSGMGVFVQYPDVANGVMVTPTATIPLPSKPLGYTKFSIKYYIQP